MNILVENDDIKKMIGKKDEGKGGRKGDNIHPPLNRARKDIIIDVFGQRSPGYVVIE